MGGTPSQNGNLAQLSKSLKAGKELGEDDIRLKMLKAMNNFGVRWLLVCVPNSLENW